MIIFKIAFRYLLSKKQFHIINIISLITAVAMLLATAALVIALSVFGGIESLVKSMYTTLTPDMQITVKQGKTFQADSLLIDTLKNIEGIAEVFTVLEENILVENEKKQHLCILKGVEEHYYQQSALQQAIYLGDGKYNTGDIPYALIGKGVSQTLDSKPFYLTPLWIYAPVTGKRIDIANPAGAFRKDYIFVSGVFSLEYETDSRLIITPLAFARELLNLNNQLTAIEITLDSTARYKTILHAVEKHFPVSQFSIKSKLEQNATLFKVFQNEKWAIFFILSFILLLASFNAVSSIAMNILTKAKEIVTLKSMGFSLQNIKRIFFLQGVFISLLASTTGVLLGLFICWLQIKFGFLQLGGNFVVSAYPVSIRWTDIILIFITVNAIGWLTTSLPVHALLRSKKYYF